MSACINLRTVLNVPGELSYCRNVLRASRIPSGGGMRVTPCTWFSHRVQTWNLPPSLSYAGLDYGSARFCCRRTLTGAVSMCTTRRHMYTPPDSQSNRFEKENILTVPNLLSVSRIALSPVLGYLVLQESYALTLGLFIFAGASDMVDGFIARTFPSQKSMLGSMLDPLADKFLMSVLCVTLTVVDLIPLPLTVLMLGRDALLIAGSFYLRYITLPPPRTWQRYWDIQRSTVQVTPSLVSKMNTMLQLVLVGLTLGAPLVDMVGHPALQALWYLTGFTTITSGASYLVDYRGFKVLRKRTDTSSNENKPP